MKQISLPLKTTMILQDLSFANIMVIDQKFVYHPKFLSKKHQQCEKRTINKYSMIYRVFNQERAYIYLMHLLF